MQLPKGLKSITRGQLLSMVDTEPRSQTGRKTKMTKAAWDKQQEKEIAEAKVIQQTINRLLDDPDTDMIAVMVCQDMCSSQLGRSMFLAIGPKRTYQVETLTPQTRVGDMPSERKYAEHFCMSPQFAKRYLDAKSFNSVMYGPFQIVTAIDSHTKQRSYHASTIEAVERPLTQNRHYFETGHYRTDLVDLLKHLDTALCSSAPFADLPKVTE